MMKTVQFNRCAEDKYPSFPDLHYYETTDGQTEGRKMYVDATHLFQSSAAAQGKSLAGFTQWGEVMVPTLTEAYGVAQEDIAVVNAADGHILLDECLDLLLGMYVDPILAKWALDRVEELILFGFTIHDPHLKLLNKVRFGENA